MLQIQSLDMKYGKRMVLENISLEVPDGQCVSLIGESGSGKSTLSRLILSLEKPCCGSIFWDRCDIKKIRRKDLYRAIQAVFQDNTSCLNPRMQIGESIREPMDNFLKLSKPEKEKEIANLLDMVGLAKDTLTRYPHELSGGQLKRVCIARAVSIRPHLILLDEAVTGLDSTIMVKILNLLKQLQREINCSYLFITHDIQAALYMSKTVAVMKDGTLVETASDLQSPSDFRHPYSKSLVI